MVILLMEQSRRRWIHNKMHANAGNQMDVIWNIFGSHHIIRCGVPLKRTHWRSCLLNKHSSLSMKSDLALISESIVSSDLVLSSFCFAVSASLNYNKDNVIGRFFLPFNKWKFFDCHWFFWLSLGLFDCHLVQIELCIIGGGRFPFLSLGHGKIWLSYA